VGPRARLDAVVKRKIPSPRRESKPRTLIVQPVVQRYTAQLPRPSVDVLRSERLSAVSVEVKEQIH
jgi:hypothetical protein